MKGMRMKNETGNRKDKGRETPSLNSSLSLMYLLPFVSGC